MPKFEREYKCSDPKRKKGSRADEGGSNTLARTFTYFSHTLRVSNDTSTPWRVHPLCATLKLASPSSHLRRECTLFGRRDEDVLGCMLTNGRRSVNAGIVKAS